MAHFYHAVAELGVVDLGFALSVPVAERITPEVTGPDSRRYTLPRDLLNPRAIISSREAAKRRYIVSMYSWTQLDHITTGYRLRCCIRGVQQCGVPVPLRIMCSCVVINSTPIPSTDASLPHNHQ